MPYLLLGTLILRLDIAFLFLIGCLYANFKDVFEKNKMIIITVIIIFIIGFYFSDYIKFPVSFLFFILLIDVQFNFFNTGRFSYLLHLYHSPIIVISYPIITLFIENALLKIIAQVTVAVIFVYILFLTTKKYKFLKILSGGR